MDSFISVSDARDAILSRVARLAPERLLIGDAVGRCVAEEIEAPFDAPAFDNSAMDGFAFRAEDAGSTLAIVGVSAAGRPFEGVVRAGEAVRIMTGARLPQGADTVAMREICDDDDGRVVVRDEVARGDHIRRKGEYLARGKAVLRPGDELLAADIGLLASFGRTVVYATRRPRVAIVTTGTELVEPDRTPGPGEIPNSNAFMLEALCRAAGALPLVVPIVADDRDATLAALGDAVAASDLVVTVGGVSVGDYDFVREVLDERTGGMLFWKVRMKPGKPLAFGVADGRIPVLGLPGNPVSSFVSFHQFVRPAIAVMLGTAPRAAALRQAEHMLAKSITSTPKREQFVLGTIDLEGRFVPHHDQSSGNVMAMRGCTALAVVPEGVAHVPEGSTVVVEHL